MIKTASEFLAELESDAEYCKRRADREAKLELLAGEHARDQAGLVSELRNLGFDVNSVYDFVNGTNTYQRAYQVLVRHLDESHNERIREGIIRSLTVTDLEQAEVDTLLAHFQSEKNRFLKWVLASALTTAMSRSERRSIPEIAQAFSSNPFA